VKRVEFHPEAQREFVVAARFYETERKGLGVDFIATVERTYEVLRESPGVGRRVGRGYRRVLVPKFPYGILYRVAAGPSTSSQGCISTAAPDTGGAAVEDETSNG
jgi:hypothetical protein